MFAKLFRGVSSASLRIVFTASVAASLGSQSSQRFFVCSSAMSSSGPKKFDQDELKKRLSPIEYSVTQEKDTERPFTGKYLHNKKPGIYTCIVCNAELFSSHDKFESGCGWPAFSEVLTSSAVTRTTDLSHGMERIEVTCTNCGAHLGHVFNDGPPPKRTRYCINSVSMSFKPQADGE